MLGARPARQESAGRRLPELRAAAAGSVLMEPDAASPRAEGREATEAGQPCYVGSGRERWARAGPGLCLQS